MSRFGARILSIGSLPPNGGELRRDYLYREGAVSYNNALDLFGRSHTDIFEHYLRKGVVPPALHSPAYIGSADMNVAETLHEEYMVTRGQMIEVAERASELRKAELVQLFRSAQNAAREALSSAVDAYNYLEDFREYEADAHALVHDIGAYVAGIFGCYISEVEGTYRLTCPVDLMHRRFGFSAGIVHSVSCSICLGDIDECQHLLNETYPIRAAKNSEGVCTACRERKCNHKIGEIVQAVATEMFQNPTMREVTVTPRPRDPRARLIMIELDRSNLEEQFRRKLSGEDLECWECLGPCPGFSGIPEDLENR